MPDETSAQAAPLRQPGFNPKPDTAEGVGDLLATTLKFVDDNGIKVGTALLEAEDGTKALFVIDSEGVTPVPDTAFDHNRAAPRWRTGTAKLLDLDSFIEHAKRFKDGDSVVFANNDRDHPSVTTVLDYHPAGSSAAPRWGRHRDTFAFPLSDEWKAWSELDGKAMEMPVFARFLEDHIIDVLPTGLLTLNEDQMRYCTLLGGISRIAEPGKLMEIATGLRIYEHVETVSAIRLQTGEAKMSFENRHQPGESGELTVPSMFALGIPVFSNGPAYQILAQLRYRPNGGKVVFWFDLWRTDRVFDHAFDEAMAQISEETGLPVLLGSPE